ncbi:ATP-grasp domain-containing protein [Candidatus Pacebacteria bacterium]|nr:ATP-grasp domain-containing protein [Candidatus Paceibacterota bacterium]
MGYHTAVYAPEGDIPAMEMATHRMTYDWNEPAGVIRLLQACDVITTEWENVPLDLIKELESRGSIVRPGSRVLEIAQNRFAEKTMAKELDIPTTQTIFIPGAHGVAGIDFSDYLPGILKTVRNGYDGKGQYPVATIQELTNALKEANVACVLEKRVALLTEISVVVARTSDNRVSVSDVVENAHQDGILDMTYWPIKTGDMMLMRSLHEKAREIAEKVAMYLELEGILCLEFFVDDNYNLLFNEMAPRPHNSFHGSIEAARTCQFEQHIRAVCGLSLGKLRFHTPFMMQNLIGGSWKEDWSAPLLSSSARLHLYGKAESRPGRKMGHVTCLIHPDN